MDDILPTVMDGQKGRPNSIPLFAWSGKQCEFWDGEDGDPPSWGKNLRKVYAEWPQYSAQNTMIIESKLCRVASNPPTNVIVSTPFYVAEMSKLADDNDYLKCYLWPLLQAFEKCLDVPTFRAKYPNILPESTDDVLAKRRLGSLYEFLDFVEGEGAGSQRYGMCYISPHFHLHNNPNVHLT